MPRKQSGYQKLKEENEKLKKQVSDLLARVPEITIGEKETWPQEAEPIRDPQAGC